jgi:hypothetical protein
VSGRIFACTNYVNVPLTYRACFDRRMEPRKSRTSLLMRRSASRVTFMPTKEIIFEVREDEADGGYCASALGYDIFTEGDTLDQLRTNVRAAVAVSFWRWSARSGSPGDPAAFRA